MKISVIVFPGSNRERDVARALSLAGAPTPALAWHGDSELPHSDLIVLPGGFSYGDYLRSGAIAAHSPIMRAVREQAAKGAAVLGICNGFQILVESGLLPGALTRNAERKFQCRTVTLKVERTDTIFAASYRNGQILRIPIAHADGNYTADPETLKRVTGNGQVAFRYCGPQGETDDAHNANGSIDHIAGIYSENGRVLGLMPHPEDAVEELHGNTDGAKFFTGLVKGLA